MPSDNQDRIEWLRSKIEELRSEAQQLAGDAQAAELSEDTIARLEEIEEQLDHYGAQLEARLRMDRLAQARGGDGAAAGQAGQRRTQPSGDDGGRRMIDPMRRDPAAGFGDMGEFARSVALAMAPQPQYDERLARMAPSTWSQESVGPDGGYLVPPQFSQQIMEYVGEQGSLYNLCEKTPVNGPSLVWPVDEDPPWSSNGPQAYWEGEGDQATQSKVNLRSAGVRLNKLVCLCPVTDELMEDAAQLGAYLQRTISKRLRWKIDFGILQGNGVGQPLGILNSPALKTVAKESGQTADTIESTNILKLWNAMYGDFRGRGMWVYNQDVETELLTMIVAGSSSDVPVYLPSGPEGGQFAGRPHTTIMGRPAMTHQACETLGDKGDIFFNDFSQYVIGQRTMGPNFASSIHLYFDYGMTAIRATWRITGMPLWSKTISARDGSATYGAFVTLAERS